MSKKEQTPVIEKPLSEKQIKKLEKEQKLAQEKQSSDIRKGMQEAGEYVRKSICNSCVHCTNRHTQVKMFETTNSQNQQVPYFAMKHCGLAGLSMVDIKTCEMYLKTDDVAPTYETQD